MKILFLISSLGSGGAERVASTLCNVWVNRGNTVTLIPTYSGGGTPFYYIDERVELFYLSDYVGNKKNYLTRIFALRKIIREGNYNVIVSFLPNVNIAALLASLFTGTPCVVCERSDPSVQPIGYFWRFACKLLYRLSDIVTVQTNAVADSISNVYKGLPEIVVVPNPVPSSLIEWSADLSGAKSRYKLISIGRLSPEKRVDGIVNIFTRLSGDFPDWDLDIWGAGPEESKIQSLINGNNMGGRIRLMGRSNNPWEIMSQADVFIMNSIFEGFPNALLEAMAVGLPCVTSDCRSGPREISDNGKYAILVNTEDGVEMENALRQLMSNKDLRVDLGQRARISINSRYSVDKVVEIWDGIFKKVERKE